MVVGILTEKNSAARNFATALGGSSSAMTGNFEGTDYKIAAARGHIYEFKDPKDMVPADKREKYADWDLVALPWDLGDFDWQRKPKKGAGSVIKDIKNVLSSVDEIVIATDVDPTGEGQLLAWEILDELDLHHKKITRMNFTDEAPASLQKAFRERSPIESMAADGEYRKADYRTKFDMFSMQSTRTATKVAEQAGRRAVLRNGRLKSAKVVMVGDQLKAHKNYKKIPSYQPKFQDDHGVIYTDPEIEQHKNKSDVPMGQYSISDVVHDQTTDGKTAPPKLLDLSGLSTILTKRGFKSADVLKTYQEMYEQQIVSYPRTEDKVVTPEQFKELEPKIDQIAKVVGVDPARLTHRSPRSTHVKPKAAHGANRPGPNVPASLEQIESKFKSIGRAIYEVLAKNYLTMLGEDYTYKTHKGHVKDFPAFVGSVTEPVRQGWKAIFDSESERADDEEKTEDEVKATTLGTRAEPFVHEGFPPKPPYPTMSWLMKQLEKRNVGTGATRTSTFAEVTAPKSRSNPFPLMSEKKGKISLEPAGELNYQLLPGTTIGSLDLTEKVYADMAKIAAGELDTDQALSEIAGWVEKDIEIMQSNAAKMDDSVAKDLTGAPAKERYTGVFVPTGEEKTFTRERLGYRLSDDECEKLLNGETLEVKHELDKGPVTMVLSLGDQTFTGRDGEVVNYFGLGGPIKRDISGNPDFAEGVYAPTGETKQFKRVAVGYRLTDEEVSKVLAGETIRIETTSKFGPLVMNVNVGPQSFTDKSGKLVEYFGLGTEIDKWASVDEKVYAVGEWHEPGKDKPEKIKFKRTWGGHQFTEAEIKDLLAGQQIEFAATSKNNKSYIAKGRLQRGEYNGHPYIGFTLAPREDAKK